LLHSQVISPIELANGETLAKVKFLMISFFKFQDRKDREKGKDLALNLNEAFR
jgi:hypothetical protein